MDAGSDQVEPKEDAIERLGTTDRMGSSPRQKAQPGWKWRKTEVSGETSVGLRRLRVGRALAASPEPASQEAIRSSQVSSIKN